MARFFFLLLLFMGGCAQEVITPAPDQAGSGAFIRGQARVLSVEPTLGRALLEFDGRQVWSYWQQERVFAREQGTVVRPNPVAGPQGLYSETIIQRQEFAAQPGDTIAFVGLRTGESIFLRGISIINRPAQ